MPTLSRRHLVTIAAALPALVCRPLVETRSAIEPDPIFAAIDKFRVADRHIASAATMRMIWRKRALS